MAFGGDHSAGAGEVHDFGRGFGLRWLERGAVYAEADDFQAAVVETGSDAQDLAAAEVADADDEAGGLDFLAQVEGFLIEEFVWAVERDGPGDLPGLRGDHADGGYWAAEVDVEVVERAAAHPIADEEGLGEIEESEGAAEQVELADAQGGAQAAQCHAGVG